MKYFYLLNFKKNVKGFTLVELLVSLALFTAIITIATGSLFSAQAINLRLQESQIILDGVNLTSEVMIRDMLYGSNFYCDTSAPVNPIVSRKSCSYSSTSGGQIILFKPVMALPSSPDPSLDRVVYRMNNGVIYKDEYAGGVVANLKTYQVTSSDVFVSSLKFYVTGAEGYPDLNQTMITMIISGSTLPTGSKNKIVPFSVETSVSVRGLDN